MTPIDYLDQILTRLDFRGADVDLVDLKRRTETLLVLIMTEYKFCYLSPSFLAATSLYTFLSILHSDILHLEKVKTALANIVAVTEVIEIHIFMLSC